MVTIVMEGEPTNFYLQLLTEKAFLNNTINGQEYYGVLKDDTREKLLKLYKNL
jgi:hypothetical protein